MGIDFFDIDKLSSLLKNDDHENQNDNIKPEIDSSFSFAGLTSTKQEEIDKKDSLLDQAISLKQDDKYKVEYQDFSETQKSILNEFDEKSWKCGTGYEAPNFPIWSEKMEGLSNGFYIFAGFSNAGKSALVMNLAYDYAQHEPNHLHFLYFTLDDTAQMVIPRFISMKKSIPISAAAKPQRYQNLIDADDEYSDLYTGYLEKRQEALNELKDFNHMLIQEHSKVECAEKMLNTAKMYKTYLRTTDPDANLIVVIDSLMDINVDSAYDRDEKERNTRISRMMKDWADNQLECPIFGTAHLRKNTGRRPVISDLKESGRYEYDATAVFLVSNDVSRSGQNAEIYYESPEDDEKHPILEILWAKNKASSFKERTYCYFAPNYSRAIECNAEITKQFDEKIYSI